MAKKTSVFDEKNILYSIQCVYFDYAKRLFDYKHIYIKSRKKTKSSLLFTPIFMNNLILLIAKLLENGTGKDTLSFNNVNHYYRTQMDEIKKTTNDLIKNSIPLPYEEIEEYINKQTEEISTLKFTGSTILKNNSDIIKYIRDKQLTHLLIDGYEAPLTIKHELLLEITDECIRTLIHLNPRPNLSSEEELFARYKNESINRVDSFWF